MSIFQKLRQVGDLQYGVYLPPDHNKTTVKPILCFLHGVRECVRSSDTEEDKERLMTGQGPLQGGTPQGKATAFIVVVPLVPCVQGDGRRSFNDNWADYAGTVRQIVEQVREEYNGDRRQIYLTGFSYGANGVLDIGPRQRDLWAALWPVDPPRPPVQSSDQPIWVSAGERSRGNKLEFQNVWGVDPEASQPNRVYEDAGLDHVKTAANAYSRADIYEWLLTHPPRVVDPFSEV